MNNLLILGAGQHGQVVKEIAESMNFFDKIDYLDDNSNHAIGKFNDYEKYKDKYNYAFVAIGNTKLRMEWIEKLENAGYILKNIIHKTAIVSNSTKLENGIVVEAAIQRSQCSPDIVRTSDSGLRYRLVLRLSEINCLRMPRAITSRC